MITDAKKLTMKSMGCQGSVDKIGQVLAAFHIEANGWYMKPTQYGEAICITGDITGINNLTGEVFNAPGLYLPGDGGATLAKALDARKNPDDTIIWEVQVSVAATDAQTKWTYVLRELQTAEKVNRRNMAAELLQSRVKSIPAPSATKAIKHDKKAA